MEELDIKRLLDRFGTDRYQRGERVILANFGTNQTMLSLIFGLPNRVQLVDQKERADEINRVVNLICGKTIVCIAGTKIPLARNREDVLLDITAGTLGLGQIVALRNLPNKRNLLDIGRDSAGFWRTYSIEGPELYLKIHEYFPRKPLIDVGWIEAEDWNMLHGKEG